MSEANSQCYVAKCKGCGAIVAAVMDNKRMTSENAKEIAGWLRDGFAVDHIPVSEVGAFSLCSCKKETAQQQPSLFEEVEK